MDLPGRRPDADDLRRAPLKADPSAQLKLLDVQELDAHADSLRHRLATLPENVRLHELAQRRQQVDDAVRDGRIAVADLTREQKRADADVEQVRARQTRDQTMLDSGSVSNPKDLERILDEVESLKRRISDLEDVELDVMERLETAQEALDRDSATLGDLDTEIASVTEARDESAGALQAELAGVGFDRGTAAEGLPADLTTLYERLRANKGGVGAAALRARQCGGCRLSLNASDLGLIAKRPADDVVRCEECDRILVRTEESGLSNPLA